MPLLTAHANHELCQALLPLFKSDFSPRLRRVTAEVLKIGDGSGKGVGFRLIEDDPLFCDGTDALEVFGMRSQEVYGQTRLIAWGEAIAAEIREALSEPAYSRVAQIVGKSASFWPAMPYAKWFPVFPNAEG